MLKKALVSTAVLTLLIVNVILWPAILKQKKDFDVIGNVQSSTVNNSSTEENSSSKPVSDANHTEVQEVEVGSFKVIDIE